MNADTFLKTVSEAEAVRVCRRAGTKLIYLKQIATGFRKPSPKMAKKLEIASGGQMTRAELRPDVYEDVAA